MLYENQALLSFQMYSVCSLYFIVVKMVLFVLNDKRQIARRLQSYVIPSSKNSLVITTALLDSVDQFVAIYKTNKELIQSFYRETISMKIMYNLKHELL